MNRLAACSLALALAASGPAAAAQDAAEPAATPAPAAAPTGPTQTAEGAQEFLRLITQQFKFVSGEIIDSRTFARSTDIRLEPAGPCKTNSTRNYEWSIGLTDGTAERSTPGIDAGGSFENYIAVRSRLYNMDASNSAIDRKNQAPTLIPAEIDWSSVSSVKTYKATQHETTERGIYVAAQPGFWLVAPDEPTAKRVAYAMEFLRSACDVSASTGF
ncbi:MAG: hypothetical protein ACEQR8_06425 [Cypionkella sp.]